MRIGEEAARESREKLDDKHRAAFERHGLSFDYLIGNAQLAAEVIMGWHQETGGVLVQRKRSFRMMCQSSAQAHIQRLSQGVSNAMESSSAHLDLISELRWINTQIASIAYDVLPEAEAAGDMVAEKLIEHAE